VGRRSDAVRRPPANVGRRPYTSCSDADGLRPVSLRIAPVLGVRAHAARRNVSGRRTACECGRMQCVRWPSHVRRRSYAMCRGDVSRAKAPVRNASGHRLTCEGHRMQCLRAPSHVRRGPYAMRRVDVTRATTTVRNASGRRYACNGGGRRTSARRRTSNGQRRIRSGHRRRQDCRRHPEAGYGRTRINCRGVALAVAIWLRVNPWRAGLPAPVRWRAA
jgi:hypothetical protein